MLLRRRAPVSGPAPADRVRALLAPAPGGWLPPPEPGDAPSEPGDSAPDPGGFVPEPEGRGLEPEGRGLEPNGRGLEPGGDGPGSQGLGPGPGGLGPTSRGEDTDVLLLERSWSPRSRRARGGSEPLLAPPDAHLADGARVRLPPALALGRLDPTRRAAAALVLVALLGAVITGAVVLRARPQEVVAPLVVSQGVPLPGASGAPAAAAGPSPPAAGQQDAADEVVVAVAGKVQRPGLVRLPLGSRVDDAVRAAGGPVPGTGPGLLNLARKLVDGEQVLVGVDPPPGAQPGPAGLVGAAGGAVAAGPLDLNAATVGDLDGLPGLGPVLAQRIVDWRARHGRFASVEQLREVAGIGEAKYEDLRERVTV